MLKSFQLQEVMKHIRLGQLCVLALWWAHLKPGKGSIRRPSMLTTVVLDKKQYTPVDAVMSPETPFFATVPLLGPAVITAPRECQLCGAGFINWRALANHCTREHGGFIEYRKRLFWEGQRCDALGLPNQRKRTMIANATSAMLQSRPAGEGDVEERREEACVVCARTDWVDMRYRCYLWKSIDGSVAIEPAEPEVDEELSSEGEDAPKQKKEHCFEMQTVCIISVMQPK